LPVRALQMTDAATRSPTSAARLAVAPSRARKVANFVVFQAAWFAAVLGASYHVPLRGTACVAAAIGWHLAVSARPALEARLILLACCIGFAVESAIVWQGYVVYPSGQPDARFAPYWLVALWGLLAIAPNVTLRWLKHRLLLAAAIGAVGGPAAFASGVRLGGARFVEAAPALATIACSWALLMPVLMWLSNRCDGVVLPNVDGALHA
jgi:hypothetical protein